MNTSPSNLPARLVIAGTHSGSGKTTIATGLMAAFSQIGLKVGSAKIGPDFIDPSYHCLATSTPGRNLDTWMCDEKQIPNLALRASYGKDLLIIEGVMGLFDGGPDGISSTAQISKLLNAPVVLVLDASGQGSSIAASAWGFFNYDPQLNIAGVIVNKVKSQNHKQIIKEALLSLGVKIFGFLEKDDQLIWRDRHLGLIPALEQKEKVKRSIKNLAKKISQSINLKDLLQAAKKAPLQLAQLPLLPPKIGDVKIGVASGVAFSFVYQDNLDALQAAGAQIITFNPLNDERLPPDIDALYIGGGFPEVFGKQLSNNKALLAHTKEKLAQGLPTWAECGGMLWLANSLDDVSLCGVIDTKATMTKKLTLGYIKAQTKHLSPLGKAGLELKGHEFHYSHLEPPGSDLVLNTRYGQKTEGFITDSLFASYLHIHLGSNFLPAQNFVSSAIAFSNKHKRKLK